MIYKLITTDEMNELLDKRIDYLIHVLNNKQAAEHLLSEIEKIYDNLEQNPWIYRESQDPFMRAFYYREAKISHMDYLIVYKIMEQNVYLLGIFHNLENYVETIRVIWNTVWK